MLLSRPHDDVLVIDPTPVRDASSAALVLLAGLTAAVVAQGAFYARGQRVLAALLVASLVLAHRRIPGLRALPRHEACGVALAAWFMARGVIAGHPRDAVGPTAVALALIAVLGVCRRLDVKSRAVLTQALLALGTLSALVGWVGVAFHITPIGLVDQGLWRAAGTLTYSNAQAGLLSPLALVALALLSRRESSTSWHPGAAFVMLVGVGATLSRAGIMGFALGATVLLVAAGPRRVVLTGLAPLAGAAVALGALLPSFPAGGHGHPILAVAGLMAGGVVAMRLRVTAPRLPLVLAAVAVAGAIAVLAAPHALHAVTTARATASSPDRVNERSAAWKLAMRHPLVGVGPGQAELFWITPDHQLMTDSFAHNEYLQVLAEFGVLGLLGLLAVFAALGRQLWLARRSALPAHWAGVAAAVTAFAFHSAFDFLWHLPAIPLVLIALAGTVIQTPNTTKETQ